LLQHECLLKDIQELGMSLLASYQEIDKIHVLLEDPALKDNYGFMGAQIYWWLMTIWPINKTFQASTGTIRA
jgi:hypothetical protein